MGNNEKLHPLEFTTITIIHEIIHDKEFLAIIDSFQEWQHLLEGTAPLLIVYIDYKNLKYFMLFQVLNCPQNLWNMS